MTTFQFSPIQNNSQLRLALEYIHVACHELCLQSLHKHLAVAGNIGVFCHSNDEYETLTKIQKTLTDSSVSVYGKYYKLYEPITIKGTKETPQALYTHLYIRKPDINKPQIGDLDFYLEPKAFTELKQYAQGGLVPGARILPNRPELDLIELYNPNIDALGYIGNKLWR